ncbi:MAG: hypothetical protein UT38_C0017G0008 [Microgenomates group bacterium GW2011_GWA2_39_19]|nr:MAG: hypothetical protein UT38_C0017G0008 [Microgenomates group bacterium GW2011_GWA2_39_19]
MGYLGADLFVGWFIIATIAAGIAQGKGRSGFNWFLLTGLFGPVGLFVLVAFFKNIDKPSVIKEG